jgi:hypothetical protein
VPIAEIYPPLYCHVTSPRPFGLLPLDHNVGLDISPSLNLIGHQLSKDSVIIRVPAISDELLELHPLVHTGKAFPDVADYTHLKLRSRACSITYQLERREVWPTMF